MQTLITVVHVLTCVFLVAAVLIQSGKGAEISASFGGSSQTVFGTSGGANFLVKFTQGAAAVFMATSLLLTVLAGQSQKSLFEAQPVVPPAPQASVSPVAAVSATAPAAQGTAPVQQNTAPAETAAPVAAPAKPTASQ